MKGACANNFGVHQKFDKAKRVGGEIFAAVFIYCNNFKVMAFSVCLEKPFVSFPGPQGTNSRISTLMKLTSLENRHFERVDQANPFEIDFTPTRPILDEARQHAINYLQNALADIERIKND